MNVDETVRALADAEAIRELARRYAHCIWQKDADGAIELFSEDGVMDTGDRPPLRGRAAMLDEYRRMLAESDLRPFVHQHVLETRGDRATGTCYLEVRATVQGKHMAGFGYYDDEYVRVAGEWKFQSRKLNMCHFGEEQGRAGG